MGETAGCPTIARDKAIFRIDAVHDIEGFLYFFGITAHLGECIVGAMTFSNINLIKVRGYINNFRCFADLAVFYGEGSFADLNTTTQGTECGTKPSSNKSAFAIIFTVSNVGFVVFCHQPLSDAFSVSAFFGYIAKIFKHLPDFFIILKTMDSAVFGILT